mgnify:CR=1 FL=1
MRAEAVPRARTAVRESHDIVLARGRRSPCGRVAHEIRVDVEFGVVVHERGHSQVLSVVQDVLQQSLHTPTT